jgi:hypothetical protein
MFATNLPEIYLLKTNSATIMIVSQVVISQAGQTSQPGDGTYMPVTTQPIVVKIDGLAVGEEFVVEYSLAGHDGWIPFSPRGAQITIKEGRNPITLSVPGVYRVVQKVPGPTVAKVSALQGSSTHEFLLTQTDPVVLAGSAPGAGGTVTSISLSTPSEFTLGGSPITTSGTLAIGKALQPAHTVWAGPISGGVAEPVFRTLIASDIPPLPPSGVSSVALSTPTEFTVIGSPVTGAGTLAMNKAVQPANTVWAGPLSGGAGQPTFRALVAADVPGGAGGGTTGSGIISIPPVSGQFIGAAFLVSTQFQTGVPPQQNATYYMPFLPSRSFLADGFNLPLDTSDPTASVRFGLYDGNGALGFYPGTLLASTGILLGPFNSLTAPIGSLIAITANHFYWLAVSFNSVAMGNTQTFSAVDGSTISLGQSEPASSFYKTLLIGALTSSLTPPALPNPSTANASDRRVALMPNLRLRVA